ncbi:MAG TPA: universal stress protein [Verrucomicrobiota bacterium]|nr:hypothetical protein [Verrucomicrobiales bacterium]HRI15864.1 universal stress protein [Verrucomicrobiota bacterium]
MTILCGTDFSPNAAEAVTVASALARRFNDTLELVHVATPISESDMPLEVWSPVEAVLRQQLDKVAQPLRATGLAVKTRLETGTPADELPRSAKPGSTRMVVLSSIGRVGLIRLVLGSTADRVAESAPVPTLVVRQVLPFQEWLTASRPLRILVAVDFSNLSDVALGLARELAEVGPCEIVAGYISDPETGITNWGAPAGDPELTQAALERDLQERVAAQLEPRRFKIAVATTGRPPSDGLIELAKTHKSDLIISGTHQHHGVRRLWHDSTSRALLADAPTSVAVVPAQAGYLARGRIPPLDRVLVTTDFSPLSNLAIPAACALLPVGGTLQLLHVLPPVERAFTLLGGHPKRPTLSPGEHRQWRRHIQRRLGSLFPAEAFRRRIKPEVVVRAETDVPAAILRQARQFGAHVICLASHGRGAALSALFGSVAQRVIAGSQRPVHIVRPRLE